MAASVRCNSAVAAQRYTPTRHRLPNGSCNFRWLDIHPPPVCGCQTFWPDNSPNDGRVTNGNSELERSRCICACGHHACFHEMLSDHDVTFASDTHYLGSEERSYRPVQYPSSQVLNTFPSAAISASAASRPMGQHAPAHPNETLAYNNDHFNDQARRASQKASTLPSTAPPSDYCYDAVDSVDRSRRQANRVETRITVPYMMDYTHVPFSATEVNTPSIADSPPADSQSNASRLNTIFSQHNIDVKAAAGSYGRAQSPQQGEETNAVRSKLSPRDTGSVTLTHDLRNIIQSYARRLDVLENSSFSHIPAEEVQDKLELVEGRLLDLETWRADADADARMKDDTDDLHEMLSQSQSQSQDRGGSDNKIGDPSRMADMEDRITMLENATPSYANPWEFEVVLLPWGSNLKGLWVTAPETDMPVVPRIRQAFGEPNGLASPITPITRGTDSCPSPCTNWLPTWPVADRCMLSPKAPGPNSVVFKRLLTRGLVRKVTITESGASHIWNTIFNAFRLFLDQHAANDSRGAWTSPEYHGLNQPLVPLRKIRRSPHLQFLSPYEMITPATWTFNFLKSGVLMRTKGKHRLYITTSDSYIQSNSGQWSWSWLRLCGLPRTHKLFDVTLDEKMADTCQDDTGEEESCWEYHANLDHFPSFEGSTSLFPESHLEAIHDGRGPRMGPERGLACSTSPAASATSLPVAVQRGRAHSIPITTSVERGIAHSSSKRRGTSPEENSAWCQKRHRTFGSPETERRATCLTPRWSREPRSPSLCYEPDVQCSRQKGTNSAHLAYATPHSNSVAAFHTAGGDTEADSDSSSDGELSLSSSENEWEGVMDEEEDLTPLGREGSLRQTQRSDWEEADIYMGEDDASSTSGDSMMSFEDEDMDGKEEDLDDGLTIYEAPL